VPTLSLDDWISSLGEAEQHGDGWTVYEIARRLGWCESKVRTVLSDSMRENKWRLSGWRAGRRIDGRSYKQPLYSPVVKGRK
jgi:hypothetical protein